MGVCGPQTFQGLAENQDQGLAPTHGGIGQVLAGETRQDHIQPGEGRIAQRGQVAVGDSVKRLFQVLG
ncbi:MAG: hypothetical protein C4309_06770 [Chloroflexota bacterium]